MIALLSEFQRRASASATTLLRGGKRSCEVVPDSVNGGWVERALAGGELLWTTSLLSSRGGPRSHRPADERHATTPGTLSCYRGYAQLLPAGERAAFAQCLWCPAAQSAQWTGFPPAAVAGLLVDRDVEGQVHESACRTCGDLHVVSAGAAVRGSPGRRHVAADLARPWVSTRAVDHCCHVLWSAASYDEAGDPGGGKVHGLRVNVLARRGIDNTILEVRVGKRRPGCTSRSRGSSGSTKTSRTSRTPRTRRPLGRVCAIPAADAGAAQGRPLQSHYQRHKRDHRRY